MTQIDTTEIGIVAAKIMEDLEKMQSEGEVSSDARIVSAMVIYELLDDDAGESTVGARITQNSSTMGLGMMERIKATLLGRGFGDED